VKRIAVLSNAIPDAWLAADDVAIMRRLDYPRLTPVALRAGMCGHLAYLPAVLQEADGMVLATSCDQMRRAAEWLDDPRRVFLFDLPSAPCDALLNLEKARLARWAKQVAQASRPAPEAPPAQAGTPVRPDAQNIGVIGGHFCGDAACIHLFFGMRGIGIRLWGCEGGEWIGDISQRPNDAFHKRLKCAVQERTLDGLVVVRTTWCDLWRAAFAQIRETSAVPVVEWVLDGQHAGQPFPDERSTTRLEAFCELVKGRAR